MVSFNGLSNMALNIANKSFLQFRYIYFEEKFNKLHLFFKDYFKKNDFLKIWSIKGLLHETFVVLIFEQTLLEKQWPACVVE